MVLEQRARSGAESDESDASMGRRSYLKLAGMAVASVGGVAGAANPAAAASAGYGANGYGEGDYGGTADQSPVVETSGVSSVDSTAATLAGSLTDLGGAASATVYFQWGEAGTSLGNATAAQTVSSTSTFAERVTGLSSGVDYEFRAVVSASDGGSDTGTTRSFTTAASSPPSIQLFSVTEAGSPDPHVEATIDWAVSDADGDLRHVEFVVSDAAGRRITSLGTDVSGSMASGTETVTVKHVKNQTLDVEMTVTDAAGHSRSYTRTVTE